MAVQNTLVGKTMEFFSWVAANWQALCKWAGGFYLVYQIGRVFTGAVTNTSKAVMRFEAAETTISRVEEIVTLLSTNHLPHIQAELEKTNEALEEMGETLSGIREDLRLVLFQKMTNNE